MKEEEMWKIEDEKSFDNTGTRKDGFTVQFSASIDTSLLKGTR